MVEIINSVDASNNGVSEKVHSLQVGAARKNSKNTGLVVVGKDVDRRNRHSEILGGDLDHLAAKAELNIELAAVGTVKGVETSHWSELESRLVERVLELGPGVGVEVSERGSGVQNHVSVVQEGLAVERAAGLDPVVVRVVVDIESLELALESAGVDGSKGQLTLLRGIDRAQRQAVDVSLDLALLDQLGRKRGLVHGVGANTKHGGAVVGERAIVDSKGEVLERSASQRHVVGVHVSTGTSNTVLDVERLAGVVAGLGLGGVIGASQGAVEEALLRLAVRGVFFPHPQVAGAGVDDGVDFLSGDIDDSLVRDHFVDQVDVELGGGLAGVVQRVARVSLGQRQGNVHKAGVGRSSQRQAEHGGQSEKRELH